ncbi:uncharacterized protein LOC124352884 [Homalodisca vitripennis]|uniref:uncharacterized protein LOC124352884 n=1 Tax=Homalodisca vitripennis TaxID=197043 RepID=UPI001EEAD248|nr:uncharacterized protein LOC124352884 [Homalodisca vitripennis]
MPTPVKKPSLPLCKGVHSQNVVKYQPSTPVRPKPTSKINKCPPKSTPTSSLLSPKYKQALVSTPKKVVKSPKSPKALSPLEAVVPKNKIGVVHKGGIIIHRDGNRIPNLRKSVLPKKL